MGSEMSGGVANVLIENCKIHHLLAGTFKKQTDAHGITGRWGKILIRNCDIGLISGDCIQFDPDRKSTGRVMIENCRLWTRPLPADAVGFKKGERPGENAVDTKTMPKGKRAQLIIRNCIFYSISTGTICSPFEIKSSFPSTIRHSSSIPSIPRCRLI